MQQSKSVVIVGASSGIGKEVARIFINAGWRVGIAARNLSSLLDLSLIAPDRVECMQIDITSSDATEKASQLVSKLGGMNLYFHVSGIGTQNINLELDKELQTCRTNVEGFARMVCWAFDYFKRVGEGHIAVVSSIAGTKGLGVAPSYSATKQFQNTYMESLEQLARIQKIKIRFTDIRPGFVKTPLLNDGNNYPLLMPVEYAAKKIYNSLIKKRRISIIDWRYSIIVFFWRLIPKFLWVRLPIKTK